HPGPPPLPTRRSPDLLFARADRLAPEQALLASNTSSISITRLAAATRRPERVFGMHFMNPVPLMQLVELVRGLATSAATLELGRDRKSTRLNSSHVKI